LQFVGIRPFIDSSCIAIMSELLPLLETLVADVDAGRPVMLCAVVKTKGSTPQHAGAAMLVRSDYSTFGTLGGGCVEAEVQKRAFEHLQRGEARLLDFVLNHDYGWDDGLICGGRMFIGCQPVTPAGVAPYRNALAQARGRSHADVPLVVRDDEREHAYRIHLETPPTLVIAGAGHVGQALARLAVGLDFHAVVIDDRADFASPERFDSSVELKVAEITRALAEFPLDGSCYVVIVTRGHRHDHQALDAVIRRDAAYLGLIGSKRKSKMILQDLVEAGVPQERIDRVHTPIGLPIGAVTVNEIAVSIAAQLIEHRRKGQSALVEELPPGGFRSTANG
jgi:xanthine dehydrogenase accessory factor